MQGEGAQELCPDVDSCPMNGADVTADSFVHYRNQRTVTQRDTKGGTVFLTDDENQQHTEGLAPSLTEIYDRVL